MTKYLQGEIEDNKKQNMLIFFIYMSILLRQRFIINSEAKRLFQALSIKKIRNKVNFTFDSQIIK